MLWGGEGDDVLIGGTGNDHLHGGSGNDCFWFAVGSGFPNGPFPTGDDATYDFAAGGTEDLLAVHGTVYDFSTLQDVLSRTTTVNGNAVIDLGGGNSVILVGVDPANLTAADFIF